MREANFIVFHNFSHESLLASFIDLFFSSWMKKITFKQLFGGMGLKGYFFLDQVNDETCKNSIKAIKTMN